MRLGCCRTAFVQCVSSEPQTPLAGPGAGAEHPVCHVFVSAVAQVNGKVFRIGHLGNMDELMMCSAISGAEMAMLDAGGFRAQALPSVCVLLGVS